MSIKKNKSRIIEVNGESYRWLISKRRKWWVGDLSVAIEKNDSGKTTLVVNPGFLRPNKYTSPEAVTGIVKPSDVREYILFARENGWNPEEPGSALVLHWDRKVITTDTTENHWRNKY